MSESDKQGYETNPVGGSGTAHIEPGTIETGAGLTGFQRDVLTVLATEGRTYGLGIKDRLETISQENINHGRLYPNLDRLVDAGLIHKTAIDKRTNGYELTDAGRAVVTAARRRLSGATVEQAAADRTEADG